MCIHLTMEIISIHTLLYHGVGQPHIVQGVYLVANMVEQVHSTSLRENTAEWPYSLEKSPSATVQEQFVHGLLSDTKGNGCSYIVRSITAPVLTLKHFLNLPYPSGVWSVQILEHNEWMTGYKAAPVRITPEKQVHHNLSSSPGRCTRVQSHWGSCVCPGRNTYSTDWQ